MTITLTGTDADLRTPVPAALPALLPPPEERLTMTDIPPDGRPEQQVEQVDPKGMTLMQVLATCDQGQVAAALNASWNEVIRQLMSLDVNEGIRKSKGSLTIKLGIEYEDGTVKLKIDEAIKTPKAPQRAAVFWVTGDGRVTPENPRQMTMFRDVPRRNVIVA